MRTKAIDRNFQREVLMQEKCFIELKELRFLEIRCWKEGCGTGIVLDMGSSTQGYPDKCPSCGANLSGLAETLPQILNKFKEFYRDTAKSKISPTFRLESPR